MSKHIPRHKTYIVLYRISLGNGTSLSSGRYRVGAKNEKEALKFVQSFIGRPSNLRVYYEVKDEKLFLNHGIVVREC